MKRKPVPAPIPVSVQEIIEQAHLMLDAKPKRLSKCMVCGSDSAPNCNEDLCWVCRRLKVSAWRDSDQQINAQE